MDIIPVNIGVKYQPAKLGLEFHPVDQPEQQMVYQVELDFLNANSDPDQAVETIFRDHSEILSPKVFAKHQIRRLVARVISYMERKQSQNKENSSAPANSHLQLDQNKLGFSGQHSKKPQMPLLQTDKLMQSDQKSANYSNQEQEEPKLEDLQTTSNRGLVQGASGTNSLMELDQAFNQEQEDLMEADNKFANQFVSSKDLMKSRGAFKNSLALDLNGHQESQDEQLEEEDNLCFENQDQDESQAMISLEGSAIMQQQQLQSVNDESQIENEEQFEHQEVQDQQEEEDDDEEDVIDIDNEEELAKRGLKRVQIEGNDDEFLMDDEGNIYDLQGNFVGNTNQDDDEEEGEEGDQQYEEDMLEHHQ